MSDLRPAPGPPAFALANLEHEKDRFIRNFHGRSLGLLGCSTHTGTDAAIGAGRYELKQSDRDVDVGEYLKDVFSSYYADFLLNFGSEQLMASLAD
jgi:hypothetical protein